MQLKANISFIILGVLYWLCVQGCEVNSEQQTDWPGVTPDSTRPSQQQIDYQNKQRVAFVHFGMNTFTNREWGTGDEDPVTFKPSDFDPNQWAKVLSETGFETLILTAKHHDGFALWPSEYTDHDIASSPYKDGEGDIVQEVSEACEKYGLDFGIYLSPWDMHEESYGTAEYNEFYMSQLRELLTNYGPISEIWFDGAKGEDAKDMEYDFNAWWDLVRDLQSDVLIFSDKGPDIRWIGNEDGFAGKTNWSTFNRDSITIGGANQGDYLNSGQKGGPDWVVSECDVSIRPGWFYHPEEDNEVKSVEELTKIYLKSVGRNCTLLLNIPPDTTGQLHPTDVDRLYAFSDTLSSIFDKNLAASSTLEASSTEKNYPPSNVNDSDWSSFWIASKDTKQPSLTVNFDEPATFNLLVLQEFIPIGQRVARFSVAVPEESGWKTVAEGTTIGHKRILPLDKTTTDKLRITFLEATNRPAINELEVYFSQPNSIPN